MGGALRAAIGGLGTVGVARRRRLPTFKKIQTADKPPLKRGVNENDEGLKCGFMNNSG